MLNVSQYWCFCFERNETVHPVYVQVQAGIVGLIVGYVSGHCSDTVCWRQVYRQRFTSEIKHVFNKHELRVTYRNINGNAARKLAQDDVLQDLEGYDIVFFGETWLKEAEVAAVYAPPGFFLMAYWSKFASESEPASGRMAVVYRATVKDRMYLRSREQC